MPYLPPAIVGLQVFGFQNSISPYGWCNFWRFSAAWERSLGPRPIFKIQRKRGFPSKPRFSDLPHDEQLIETCSLTAATWWRTWPSVGPLQGSGTWVVNVGYLITLVSNKGIISSYIYLGLPLGFLDVNFACNISKFSFQTFL